VSGEASGVRKMVSNRKPKPVLNAVEVSKQKWIGLFAIVVALIMCGARAEAQQTTKIPRIGFLTVTSASGSVGLLEPFRQEMRNLGWSEGKNITIEYRFADQQTERLPELAMDLVRLKVDLLLVVPTPAALAAKRATTSIPIVMVNAGDPVGVGLVASLARPGGNVTGNSGYRRN
jgi:putative tryptophan/tyrosine transport system substrate-binding protein